MRSVFAHYRTHHPRSYKTPLPASNEWKKIAARLKEGYSVDDLCRAIDGCHKSSFHCGQNERGEKYQSLDLIMRDGGQVTKFIEHADEPRRPQLTEKTQRSLLAAENWANRGGGHNAGN